MYIANPKQKFNIWWYTTFILLIIPISTCLAQYETEVNPRLEKAYIALQAWKHWIISDPNDFTGNWMGYDVCSYNGVYCAPALDDPNIKTVAGIDLNHANIGGKLPQHLGLLSDLALFHINSNQFFGIIPWSFSNLKLLHEIDLSNNLFCGPFPPALLCLDELRYLDIRFNAFEGPIPPEVFDLKLDALFLNNNKFTSPLPQNVANSPVSVLVLANNHLEGCFPELGQTLEQVILINSGLKGCLPNNVGKLKQVTVFDVSYNQLTGTLPQSIGEMKNLQQLNVANNKLFGEIPISICELPHLENFTYSYNYISGDPHMCLSLKDKDDRFNCIPNRPLQRSPFECEAFLSFPPQCSYFPSCPASSPP